MRILATILIVSAQVGCRNEEKVVFPAETSTQSSQEESPVELDSKNEVLTPLIAPKDVLNTFANAATKEQAAVRSIDELLLFFPSNYPAGNWKPTNLDYEDVWFESADGTKLHGWYCPTKEPTAVVLFAHGNGGHLAHRAELLRFLQTEMQVTVMMFDYRGYGRSEGVPTVKGVLEDARAASKALADHTDVKESDLVLMGRSLGGAVMIDLAAETNPRALVIESTFSSLREVATVHYPKLSWLVPASKLNSVARITAYRGPVLQSHGTADHVIAYQLGQRLFEAANEPKEFVTITNGTHNSPQGEEYYETLKKFLNNLR